MTTLQVIHDAPSQLGSPHRHSYSLQFTLNDLPHELSSTQLEAKQVLAQLLSRIKDTNSQYYAKYGSWIERHPTLEDFCFQCVRPQVWTFLQGRWSLDTLKTIGGDLKFEGRGVYLNGVLGLDKRVRIYVGQASSIRQRVAQHLNFRYRRDNPSLHYLAMQQSTYNSMGILATLPPSSANSNNPSPGMDKPDLLLNILEMWMCLILRSLPTQTLEIWLPQTEETVDIHKEGTEGKFGGLNIASPLDQGDKWKDWIDLSGSDDLLVLNYIGKGARSRELEERKKKYAENARKRSASEDALIHVPQWVVFGGLAVALGFVLFGNRRVGRN